MNNAEIWNRIVAVKSPIVRDVESLLNCRLKKVYEHAQNILCAESNLLLRLPIGRDYRPESPIVSMSLILRAEYLSSLALVKPSDLKTLSIFGIPLEGSANQAKRALEQSLTPNLDLVTEAKRWIIYCGKALAFEFSTLPPLGNPDPDRSEIVAISYYFSVPYTGIHAPIVE